MNIDDPKLTAFALGELDEAERREVEALLRENPEAAAEVKQVREFSTLVKTILAGESAPALDEGQRRELLASAKAGNGAADEDEIPENEKPATGTGRYRLWIPSAIAALVMIGAWYGFLSHREPGFMRSQDFSAPDSSSIVDLKPEAPAPGQQQHFSLSPAGPVPASTPAPLVLSQSVPSARPDSPNLPMTPQVSATTSTSDGDLARRSAAAPAPAEAPVAKNGPYSGSTKMPRPVVVPQSVRLAGGGVALQTVPAAPAASDHESRLQPQNELTEQPAPSKSAAAKPGSAYKAVDEVNFHRDTALKDTSTRREAAPAREELKREVTDLKSQLGQLEKASGGARAKEAAKPDAGPATRLAGLEPEELQKLEETKKKIDDVEQKLKALESPAPLPPAQPDIRQASEPGNTESYDTVTDNPFLTVKENPLSTFSIDVDTASYANVRRFLNQGTLPPKGAVRIEELINYFTYDYPQPQPGEPFSVNMEVAGCPWAPEHRLLRVGLKARELPRDERPAANLVFLIDVSGSMMPPNRLPLVKESLRLMVDQLGPKDTVAIAVYAGNSGTVLEPTSDKEKIREALGRLEAGGSTNGASGIRLAYDLAKRSFDRAKSNRVILATDGDFNVGVTNQSDLTDLITQEAKSGVFLTVLGVGYGNLKDSTLEKLADKGNGNYAYIDSLAEGRRVLVEQMTGTLFTVAKDVKLQIEFNPAQVSCYRLIGYENRLLQKEDFNDDKKDAGEIGAGHTVTALYELVPANVTLPTLSKVDPLKYQPAPMPATAAPSAATAESAAKAAPGASAVPSNELLTLKLRWKAPDAETSTLKEVPLSDAGTTWEKSSKDFRWAASVASFGMLLRDSPYKGSATWASTKELAEEGRGGDTGYRAEFLGLIDRAAALRK